MPLAPAGAEEQRRAARRSGRQLQADRVILQQTRSKREVLLSEFDSWLGENWRCTLQELIGGNDIDGEGICVALVAFGKQMYNAGKSYGKVSETINAITARRSVLRKQVSAAWDLAFNWVTDEARCHHDCMHDTCNVMGMAAGRSFDCNDLGRNPQSWRGSRCLEVGLDPSLQFHTWNARSHTADKAPKDKRQGSETSIIAH